MSDLHTDPYSAPPPQAMTAADVLGFDPADPDFLREPYVAYGKLRERGALVRTAGGLLVATTHEHCTTLLRDPRFGHGPDPLGKGDPTRQVESFLLMDPPDHTRLRALVSRAFTPRMVERLRPRVEAIAAQLIEKLEPEADLLSAYAYPLPVMVITEMLGVPPEDHERFSGWSETLARSLDPCCQASSPRRPIGHVRSSATISANSSPSGGKLQEMTC